MNKIQIEPVPEGYTKVSGQSVEDVLEILEAKGINKIFCRPYVVGYEEIFRKHIIILRRSDYDRLNREGDFGLIDARGGSLSNVGFYCNAKYKIDDFSRIKSKEIKNPFPEEQTQLRMFCASFSADDSTFLIVNNLELPEAMEVYE